MRVIRCFLCVLILAPIVLAVNPPVAPESHTPAPAYPNVILITLDTTRADRMGFMGSKRGLTPHLDALAKQSTVFTHAYSQAPLTPASHATMLTGTYPQYHQVLTFPIPLAKTLPWMPEILQAHGYHTGAFVGSLALAPQWGVPGFDRGFDLYDAPFGWDNFTPAKRYKTSERRAGDVVKVALEWLKKQPQDKPFFLWVHVFDPHDPYEPPEPYKTRYAKAPYDGEIAYVDSAMGTLFAALKARGVFDGAAIVVTADHGESLGAHGEDQHGIFLYDETIHVPLLIKQPHQQIATGKRIDQTVELVDIMPTVLGVTKIDVPKDVQGISMLDLMKAGPEDEATQAVWRDRGAYSQSDYGHLAFAWSTMQSWRSGKYLYIQAPRRELYDQTADAGEVHNLAAASPAIADTLAARVAAIQQKTTNTGETPKILLDEKRTEKLSALGYIGGTENPALASSPDHGADPKDKIQVANYLLRINDYLENKDCPHAMTQLEKGIAFDPNISLFHFFLGGCYLDKKDYEHAMPQLRLAVKLDPGFTHAALNLGRTEMELGNYSEAADAFETVVKTEPHLMDAYIYLVIAYAKLNRVPEEIATCRRVLQTWPDHYGSNLNLGRFLAQSGDLQGAIPSLQKAAELRPTAPVPHIYLAEVYTKLGKDADAAHEREEAERLGATPAGPIAPEPDAMPQPAPVAGPGVGPGGPE